jgi:outer membrane protein assembly factor BamB
MAASSGHPAVAKVLLEKGADPNHTEGFYGADPMGMAMFKDHPEVALVLVKNGADNRAGAFNFGVQKDNEELARAAFESGPFYESSLKQMRMTMMTIAPKYKKMLDQAKSRPDPEPPVYTVDELKPFQGKYEGWDSGLEVVAKIEGEGLVVSINGEDPVAVTVVGDKEFATEDGQLQVSFSGRAGEIEGVMVQKTGTPPGYSRRSVAEPVGAEAYTAESGKWVVDEPTVNWPQFRGENAIGIGDGADTLVEWDLESGAGVKWTADLPGLGNSSPVVWGDTVIITTAVAEGIEQNIKTGLTGAGDGIPEEVPHSWRVMAFDKKTGKTLWDTEIANAVPETRRHFKATQANSTAATDGKHVCVIFATAGMACLDMDGKIKWHKELGGLNAGAFTDPGIQWGFASSPIIHGGNVIQQIDIHDGPYMVAWDLETGNEVWRVEREVAPSWATPAILKTDQGDELIVNGSTIHGYNAATGEELWSLGPNSELVIAAPVVGEGVVYVSAGYPPVKPIYAVKAGTRGDLEVDPRGNDDRLIWSHGIGGAYMPTPLLYRGIYYVVHHNGRLVTYDAKTGEAIYKSRFSKNGVFTGSPVAVNGTLYLPTEEGYLYVLEAGPEYKELAMHEFGEPLMATPAVSEGVLFFRTPSNLIAIGR